MIYPSIRIEGAILSPDILDHLDDAPGQCPDDHRNPPLPCLLGYALPRQQALC